MIDLVAFPPVPWGEFFEQALLGLGSGVLVIGGVIGVVMLMAEGVKALRKFMR